MLNYPHELLQVYSMIQQPLASLHVIMQYEEVVVCFLYILGVHKDDITNDIIVTLDTMFELHL